jgi:peptide/nickel transport system permease protein
VAWLGGAARLDLGRSFAQGVPVAPLVASRAANTATLAVTALVLAGLVGLPLGTLLAGRRGLLAAVIRGLSIVAISLPPLVLSLVLAWIAARTRWFPAGGMTSPATVAEAWTVDWTRDVAAHLVVPVLALAIPLAASLERLQSRALADALGEPCLLAARARGASLLRVRTRHATRLAAAPVVSVLGLLAGHLLSGSFGVEVVTGWPGLGRLAYDALLARDVPLVTGCAAAAAALVAAATFAADLVMFWLDPRTRSGG